MTDALIVIDMQQGPFGDKPPWHDVAGLVGRLNRLADGVRTTGGAVIFIQHDGPPGDPHHPDSPGWRFLPDLDVRLADAEHLRVDEPFDAVFSNAALHWMTRPDDVLAGVRAALRAGGRFVAEMGAARNVTAVVAALREAADRVGLDADLPLPWYFPTPAELATRLERAGFTVRLLQYVDRPTRLTEVSDGAADWWRMFGATTLAGLDPVQVDELLAVVNEVAAPQLLGADGVWVADYVRLRFVAEADA